LRETEFHPTVDPPKPGVVKSVTGGVLMGIANLIPGVSGGTMILAMGLYTEFIDSVADLTALRFSRRRILFLLQVGVGAAASILLLAGVILDLLFRYPVAMYALFIGMTLGGAPLLVASLRPIKADAVIATLIGLGLMIGVVAMKSGSGLPHHLGMDLVSGVVGSTTMVLPGISGSYMLLVMDQYDRVIGAVHALKEALQARDVALLQSALWIVAPVGIGAVVGIVGLSNLLKYLLRRRPRETVGVLLGVLLGSVVGLWPFGKMPSRDALAKRTTDELVAYADAMGIDLGEPATGEPATGGLPRGDDAAEVRAALASSIREHWERRAATDLTGSNIALAGVMVLIGFGVTFQLGRRGAELRTESRSD
jgi:putative membrane protein